MKGTVISYISAKKYGFITGEDGESYFLHVSSLLDKANEAKLIKGIIVEFDPTPTPKGMSAKKVHVPEVYLKKTINSFIMTKQSKPKYGQVEIQRTIHTMFFKDPNAARANIKRLARQAGCNAILNLRVEKATFSEGNYKYTMHAFSGNFAIVTDEKTCDSKQEMLDNCDKLVSLKDEFSKKFAEIQRLEGEARRAQIETSHTGCLMVIGFLFFILLMWAI